MRFAGGRRKTDILRKSELVTFKPPRPAIRSQGEHSNLATCPDRIRTGNNDNETGTFSAPFRLPPPRRWAWRERPENLLLRQFPGADARHGPHAGRARARTLGRSRRGRTLQRRSGL